MRDACFRVRVRAERANDQNIRYEQSVILRWAVLRAQRLGGVLF